jgi:signal transduction histidine kinase
VDAAIACGFIFFSSGTFPMIIYLFVLTQFYLNFVTTKSSIILFIASTAIYACFEMVQGALITGGTIQWFALIRETFGSMFVLLVHFVIVQVAWAFYRQFVKLDKTLKQLDESNKELEKAYETVAEMTALEERQRIAKEIHDTAGHSITTVIMQTEAAKLIIESNPDEAKSKIVAANLQAKHALEELRNSVHLLSGMNENETLKTAVLGIIHESTDGTGIAIRSNVEEVKASPTKHRFICNTLKEGISNALRHGGATAFWFELKEEDGKIYFLLSDNGKGVNVERLNFGFGLSTTMERAKMLGGEIKVESEEGEGFELHLILPADKQ